mgnify:CR=1 FL=1
MAPCRIHLLWLTAPLFGAVEWQPPAAASPAPTVRLDLPQVAVGRRVQLGDYTWRGSKVWWPRPPSGSLAGVGPLPGEPSNADTSSSRPARGMRDLAVVVVNAEAIHFAGHSLPLEELDEQQGLHADQMLFELIFARVEQTRPHSERPGGLYAHFGPVLLVADGRLPAQTVGQVAQVLHSLDVMPVEVAVGVADDAGDNALVPSLDGATCATESTSRRPAALQVGEGPAAARVPEPDESWAELVETGTSDWLAGRPHPTALVPWKASPPSPTQTLLAPENPDLELRLDGSLDQTLWVVPLCAVLDLTPPASQGACGI